MEKFLWEPSDKRKKNHSEDFSKFINSNQTIISKNCGNGL